MPISTLYLLDSKGKAIISRDYRGDTSPECLENFVSYISDAQEADLKPIFEKDGVSYIFIKHNDIFVLAVVTRPSSDATVILSFLYKLIEVLREYFTEVVEESIRNNFVIIYELLDEMLNFGYPQVTEAALLKKYITQKSHHLSKARVRVPKEVMDRVSWRPEDVSYSKNEVYLDVVEKVNLLVSASGAILHSEIFGQILVRCLLSGMPELRLGLNDRIQLENHGNKQTNGIEDPQAIEIEDVKFHRCVRFSKIGNDRTISFIPPDGSFELMSYRLSTNVRPIIWIETVIDAHAHSRIDYLVKLKSQFRSKSMAHNVIIDIPVPSNADSPTFKSTIGTVCYRPEKNVVTWSIKMLLGGNEYMMRAHLGLSFESEVQGINSSINVKFEIPYYSISGLQVKFLRILEKSGYPAFPWVRYITKNGDYQIRIA
ncbi:AP-1 complex subunit mu-like [Schistocerca gregaria]|uniref:AP-1 complex subunit mu-like n=1 Tax=Schistocerca gregaria TaxID=7010 RepID=UPI00211EED64|nr:AP-1 complex subunit mu-like [Schistocerca gregaria]